MTFDEWDAANRDALWNGGKTPLREQYRAVWNAAIKAAAGDVPTNWCDPLLSGKGSIRVPADCPQIEKLLHGLRERIECHTGRDGQ